MGRATIIGGGTDGLYTVEIDYGRATRDAMVFVLNLRIAELTALIGELTVKVEQAEADTAAARELANIAVQEFAAAALAEPGGDHSALVVAVTRTTADLSRALAVEVQLRVRRDLLKTDRAGQQKEKGALESAVVSSTRAAWCADLTESASGSVATIDIPGEDRAIILMPGCRAPAADDGQLMAREVMSPAQAFFNAAVLPGWQKWMPTYRKGTITRIDKEWAFADVNLDAALSSAADLDVNQAAALANVPVYYMTCGAEVFEVGDRVVVEFVGMAQSAPKVIGFVDNPRTCTKFYLHYRVNSSWPDNITIGTTSDTPPEIAGDKDQEVFKGGDATPVSVDLSGSNFEFLGWSDGISTLAREDLNVQADATLFADFVHFEAYFPAYFNSGRESGVEFPRFYISAEFPENYGEYNSISFSLGPLVWGTFTYDPPRSIFLGQTMTLVSSYRGVTYTKVYICTNIGGGVYRWVLS